MKYYLVLLVLISSSLVQADGVKLSCSPEETQCLNCPEYQTLFNIEEFSKDTGSLDIESDSSEILSDKYLLNGNVEVNSESLFLAADEVEISTDDNSLIASGDVRFQDQSYLITSDFCPQLESENDELTATATNANYQDFAAGLGGANGYTEII